MDSPIKPPDGKLFPSESNNLRIDSFYSLPPGWRWSVGKLTEDGYAEYRFGFGAMDQKAWDAWGAQTDSEYIPPIVAAQLGLTLA